MATYYLDFASGNDASAGTSWATAWKTLNNGATAARIAPGDEIRIAKTADPTSIGNGTWTNKSATVTLATAQTATITLDDAWTAANSGSTNTNTSVRKEGTNCMIINTAASTAISTKYAYKTIGGANGLDLSSYDAITLWFRNSNAVVANNYQIKLCSDTIGDTAVDTFDIPASPAIDQWIPLTLTRSGGGNLGNAIKSIAWYTGTVSPGNNRQIVLDDILACDKDGLNLTSLISKNSAAYGGTETWHGLQSIDGTTVILGNLNSYIPTNTDIKGYSTTGTSPATVTTYVRPTVKFGIASSATTSVQPLTDTGSAGSLITYSGGWNTTNTTQDGMTWIDGENGFGRALSTVNGNYNYLKFTRLGMCRFDQAIWFQSGSHTGHVFEDCMVTNCNTGFHNGLASGYMQITANNCATVTANGGSGLNSYYDIKMYNNSGTTSSFTQFNFYNNLIHNNSGGLVIPPSPFINNLEFIANAGVISFNNAYFVKIETATIKDNTGTTGLTGSNTVAHINTLVASNNATLGAFDGPLYVNMTNATSANLVGTASSTTRIGFSPALNYGNVNLNNTDNRSYWRFGNALSQTTTRKTASGIAWQINITNTAQTANLPIYFPIAKVACNANALVTVKAWVKLSHATDIGAKLMIQAGEIAGVSADVTASKSADTNWEELTITFTPTIAGVAQIYVQGYWLANLADESIFVDDVTITQA